MRYLTHNELGQIFNTNSTAIQRLANSGKIPYKIIDGAIRFCPADIKEWSLKLRRGMGDKEFEDFLLNYKKEIWKDAPEAVKIIQEYGSHFTDPAEPKEYYLEAVKNKKLGFVYYVKYRHNGELIPSKWTTRTNDRMEAERYAVENKNRLLEEYFNRKTVKKPYVDIYIILKRYYAKDSPYLQIDRKNGRRVSEDARVVYHNFVINQFIPYLRKQGVKVVEEIDTPFMARFRNWLMTDRRIKGVMFPGIKPQSTKNRISHISAIFDHLLEEGHIKTNPCKSLKSIRVKKSDQAITGCYETDEIKGIFNKRWKNELSYLLSMLMYTTNMRNSEIERVQVKDFIMIGNINFIDIPESKSENGKRVVPLHPFVRRKIMAYAKKNKKGSEDLILKDPTTKKLCSRVYKRASVEMGQYLGYTKEQLERDNMRFYSGRHFWKTLMRTEGLGEDIEEVFMGHKVTSDIKRKYTHWDKAGRKKLTEKAKKVIAILDKCIFR